MERAKRGRSNTSSLFGREDNSVPGAFTQAFHPSQYPTPVGSQSYARSSSSSASSQMRNMQAQQRGAPTSVDAARRV
eukprot:GSA25T00002482001.1